MVSVCVDLLAAFACSTGSTKLPANSADHGQSMLVGQAACV
jgi:hypothetical protein